MSDILIQISCNIYLISYILYKVSDITCEVFNSTYQISYLPYDILFV